MHKLLHFEIFCTPVLQRMRNLQTDNHVLSVKAGIGQPSLFIPQQLTISPMSKTQKMQRPTRCILLFIPFALFSQPSRFALIAEMGSDPNVNPVQHAR